MKNKVDNIQIKQLDATEWEKNIEDFKYSMLITREWLTSISNAQKQAVFFDFICKEKVVAKLGGLMIKGSRFQGDQLYFYAGPACLNPEPLVYNNACEGLLKFAKNKGVNMIVMRYFDHLYGYECHVKGFQSNMNYDFVINLQDPEYIKKINKRLKKYHNIAKKEGIRFVKDNSSEKIERLIELLNETKRIRYSKYGENYSPFTFNDLDENGLYNLMENQIGCIYYLEINGEIPIIHFELEKDENAYGLIKGSNALAYEKGLHRMLYTYIISHYQESGFQRYNLAGLGCGSAEDEGLFAFKESIGGVKTKMHGARTGFIQFPQALLNPIIKVSGQIPSNGAIDKVKKVVYRLSSAN